MKAIINVVLSLSVLVLLVAPALAGETLPDKVSYLKLDQGAAPAAFSDRASGRRGGQDAQLDSRKADFEKFARAKIGQMNKNLNFSRDRMQIRKEADGSYRAVFHEIDGSSLGYEVSCSQSKSIPYVAVLTYREQIFAASGQTPEQCRKGPFNPVGFIPNRHIFSYSKGVWN
ncbi:MAG: hypothetical protein NDI73_05955 [Desulfuromonadales bacterium]|nr:hypothetical protein [Desulfuromonadales bacterium]